MQLCCLCQEPVDIANTHTEELIIFHGALHCSMKCRDIRKDLMVKAGWDPESGKTDWKENQVMVRNVGSHCLN